MLKGFLILNWAGIIVIGHITCHVLHHFRTITLIEFELYFFAILVKVLRLMVLLRLGLSWQVPLCKSDKHGIT